MLCNAKTGARIYPKLPSLYGDYEDAFAALISQWTKLPTPPNVRIIDIEDSLPHSTLSHLQRSANLPIAKEKHCAAIVPGNAGMLNGLDKLINEFGADARKEARLLAGSA